MGDARPRIAVIGGTGALGSGLAARWAGAGYPVVIGSRDADRATAAAAAIAGATPVRGASQADAAAQADIVVLAVPFASHAATLDAIRPPCGGETWFRLGDRDLAVHVERTRRLAAGESLSAITTAFCRRLGVASEILPVSDDHIATIVAAPGGPLAYQHYFVRHRCEPVALGFTFAGATTARLHPRVLALLASPALRDVVIGPSNPYVSIGPMPAIPGLRDALAACRALVVGVSPIVGGDAVEGPAAKMMRERVIVQNFRAKPDTRMASVPDAAHADHLRAIALARLILPPEVSIQAPPNLSLGHLEALIAAGIDDWGGVSPVTIDHVNPEAPWPSLAELDARTHAAGKVLGARLPLHRRYAVAPEPWVDPDLLRHLRAHADAKGLARDGWTSGQDDDHAPPISAPHIAADGLAATLARACDGALLTEREIVDLFAARGGDFGAVCDAADALRREVAGDTVIYVVTRNINYTNICHYHCRFCAFSKGKTAESLRGRPYDPSHAEIAARAEEAWARGGTEVCMQGGIHPDYTGRTYLDILTAVKRAVPGLHVHAFSRLEVWQGAATLGVDLATFLLDLKRHGLGSLPGTAAEILDDEVRAVLCPDKLTTAQWLEVMRTAHALGLRSTATIMYGHVERPVHWARHLIRLRNLQRETGGITEFVPLPFVHMEAPIYLKGGARKGPTWREAVLMHAVGRLALHPWIANIQTSWVKMGSQGAAACLNAGANDLGGTLMNESITRAAGAAHGQDMPPEAMDALIRSIGRTPRQRTTLYGTPPDAQVARSDAAAPLRPIALPPPPRRARQPALATS